LNRLTTVLLLLSASPSAATAARTGSPFSNVISANSRSARGLQLHIPWECCSHQLCKKTEAQKSVYRQCDDALAFERAPFRLPLPALRVLGLLPLISFHLSHQPPPAQLLFSSTTVC
jgi:hypothetical protein